MSYKLESDVIKDFGELLKTGANYDVLIHVGEKPDFKEFHAHSNILGCRSEYFNKALSEKEDGKYIIKMPKITPRSFQVILVYLYTGHFNITNKTGNEILNISIVSNDLRLNQLIKLSQDFLIENHHQFLRNDPIGILQTIYPFQLFNDLQEFCLETICFNPEILFNSSNFVNLPAPLLEVILKRDDFNLNEIEIWENLIKWGVAQEKNLGGDVSKWSHEDFNVFKEILHKFIPLIRFNQISSDDYRKFKPYEEILSKDLRDDISKYYEDSEPSESSIANMFTQRYSKSDVDSIIINNNHVALFASWIDKKDDDSNYVKSIPYEFSLLYRSSRDGNTVKAFHDRCDDKGATIVVAKIANSDKVVGGYNPLFWNSNKSWMSTNDSFVFSFINIKNDAKDVKVGYSNGDPYSIGCFPSDGPRFGGGNDLVHEYSDYKNSSWTSNPYSYPDIDISASFKVDDYEVFQVVNKITKNTLKKTKINQIEESFQNDGGGDLVKKKEIRKEIRKEILTF